MGRAIDMEKDIDMLKAQIKSLEDIVRGMTYKMDGLEEKSTTIEHVNLVDDVKVEEENDGKEKANDKRDGKSSKSDNKTGRVSKRKAR